MYVEEIMKAAPSNPQSVAHHTKVCGRDVYPIGHADAFALPRINEEANPQRAIQNHVRYQ
jgi:hypothetical protein